MRAKDIDKAEAAAERAELYYKAHPGTPSTVRRPRMVRSGTWVTLLGRSLQDGIAGFGSTIEAALCARAGRAIDRFVARTRGSVVPSRGLIKTTPIVRSDS